MTLRTINLGNYANDGTGDDLRSAFEKVNFNFNELSGSASIIGGSNLGSGQGVFAQRNVSTLEFKSLTSIDNSVTLTSSSNSVNLKANTKLLEDLNPKLGGDLDINGHIVRDIAGGGDVQTTIYGISVPLLNSLLALLVESNSLVIDLGSLLAPTGQSSGLLNGYVLDMGYFANPTGSNPLNFGSF